MFGKWRGRLKLGQALKSNVLMAAFGLTISPSLTPDSLAELDESAADAALFLSPGQRPKVTRGRERHVTYAGGTGLSSSSLSIGFEARLLLVFFPS